MLDERDRYVHYGHGGPGYSVRAPVARRAPRHDDTDELCARIEACIDGRDYTELEHPASGWQRWAYYASIGAW